MTDFWGLFFTLLGITAFCRLLDEILFHFGERR